MLAESFRPRPRHVPLPQVPESVQEGVWFLPSRAREQRAKDTMRACADAGQTTPGLLIQDGCRYSLKDMPSRWQAVETVDHLELAGAIHAAWTLTRGKAWYGIISDGVRPVTKHWDRLLIAASEGKNFVSCNDNWRRDSRMAGILLVPGWIVEALGYFFPAGMIHLWTDDIWEQIGATLDNWVYLPDVTVVDHHWSNPSARVEHDATSKRAYKGVNLHDNDRNRFREWRYGPEFGQAIARIKSAWKMRTGKEWGDG